jgi:alpha-glucosidase
MPYNLILITSIVFILLFVFTDSGGAWIVPSPQGSAQVHLQLDRESGLLFYSITMLKPSEKVVLEPSALGLIVDGENYRSGLVFDSKTETKTQTESYTLLSGKQLKIEDTYNQACFNFRTVAGEILTVEFRVFENGAAFRYAIDHTDKNVISIFSESTSFNLPVDGRFWAQPYDAITKWTPAYEAYFENGIPIGTRAPEDKNGWALPFLAEYNGVWTLVAEAAVYDGNIAVHLQPECPEGNYKVRFPEEDEAYNVCAAIPTVELPWKSPWRTILFSTELSTIVESNLITTLAREIVLENTDWIHPGRSSWSWWSDSDSPRDYNTLKKFVDFTARMGWEYFLVDANWNHMQNGDLEKLAEYAGEIGVGLLVWYNSGGPHNTVTEEPRDLMHEAGSRRETFAWLQEIGIRGVKIDFFQSDKGCIMQQYIDILEDAARYELVVNFHGNTSPRGWRRTYPNLLTMEAVKGAECYKFDPLFSAAAPMLNTIYPFTRNVIGPMDYTPVTFSHNTYPHFTSYAHELALSVIFESGIVHFADAVEAYESLPEEVLSFLRDVPVIWDETRFISGYPGKDVVLARRHGNNWYVAGINGESENKTVNFSFDFLADGAHQAKFITDGRTNQHFNHSKTIVRNTDTKSIELLQNGGFVGVITPGTQ